MPMPQLCDDYIKELERKAGKHKRRYVIFLNCVLPCHKETEMMIVDKGLFFKDEFRERRIASVEPLFRLLPEPLHQAKSSRFSI